MREVRGERTVVSDCKNEPPAGCGSSGRTLHPPSPPSLFSLRVSLSPCLLTMEAAQKMVKQRSMEALDKLRTYTNVEENSRRGSTYHLVSGAGAKEPSHISQYLKVWPRLIAMFLLRLK